MKKTLIALVASLIVLAGCSSYETTLFDGTFIYENTILGVGTAYAYHFDQDGTGWYEEGAVLLGEPVIVGLYTTFTWTADESGKTLTITANYPTGNLWGTDWYGTFDYEFKFGNLYLDGDKYEKNSDYDY